MNVRKTKAELLADNLALATHNHELRKRIDFLEFKLKQHTNSVAPALYPLIDGLGRRYRLEGRIRCYPAKPSVNVVEHVELN